MSDGASNELRSVSRITVAREGIELSCHWTIAGSSGRQREIGMSGQAARQGYAAGAGVSKGRAKSTIIGVGLALTVVALGGVMMMAGPEPSPVATQVAAVSAPSVVAQTPAIAPAVVAAPVQPAQAVAPVINVAPPPALVAAPPPAEPAPPLNAPRACQIGQVQQLAMDISATQRREVGNVLRIFSGSYVSPPIVVTSSIQTVTFPAPPGSNGSATVIVEQKTGGGWTFETESNGVTAEVDRDIDSHRQFILLRWTTPRC
jgi:hypothetical protein